MVPIPFWKLVGYILLIIVYCHMTEGHIRYPDENMTSVFFKLLPVAHLLFMVMSTEKDDQHSRDDGFTSYRNKVALALVASFFGDAFMVWRVTAFIPGLLCFAVVHVLYIRAFRFKPIGGAPTFVSCFLLMMLIYLYILPGITEGPVLQALVLLYCVLIVTMAWRALVLCQWAFSFSTLFGLVGASLFVLSDFTIAYDKWREPIENSSLKVMVIYWAAQMFLSLSAACYVSRPKLDY